MLTRVIDSDGFNAVVRARHGYVAYNKNDIYVGRAIEKYGEYGGAEAAMLRALCAPGDTVVDVGANIGAHTLTLSRAVGERGRVCAFEPQREVFQTLCANMALNSVINADCFQLAAGAEAGHVVVPHIRYDLRGNFGGVPMNDCESGAKVPKVRLDDFLESDNLRLLKIDVEGMEAEVIEGARRLIARFRPVLYVENDQPDRSRALIDVIGGLGYRMFWHMPPLFNRDNFAGDAEDLWPGLTSTNMLCLHASAARTPLRLPEVLDPNFHPLRERW